MEPLSPAETVHSHCTWPCGEFPVACRIRHWLRASHCAVLPLCLPARPPSSRATRGISLLPWGTPLFSSLFGNELLFSCSRRGKRAPLVPRAPVKVYRSGAGGNWRLASGQARLTSARSVQCASRPGNGQLIESVKDSQTAQEPHLFEQPPQT